MTQTGTIRNIIPASLRNGWNKIKCCFLPVGVDDDKTKNLDRNTNLYEAVRNITIMEKECKPSVDITYINSVFGVVFFS